MRKTICGSCMTDISRCLPGSSVFSHQHCEETLLIDLTFEKDGNCEQNGSVTMVSCWHMHVYPLFCTESSKMSPGCLALVTLQHFSLFILANNFVKTAWVNESFTSERNLFIATVGKN